MNYMVEKLFVILEISKVAAFFLVLQYVPNIYKRWDRLI